MTSARSGPAGTYRKHGREQRAGNREGAEGRAHTLDVLGEEGHGIRVGDLLQLHRVAVGVRSDKPILVERPFLPLRLRGHGPKGREDVRVVRGARLEALEGGRHEHLIAPVDRQASLGPARVDACLAHDGLEDGHGAAGLTHSNETRELHRRLVVVLGPGERRESRALARRVVEGHRLGALDLGEQVNLKLGPSERCGLDDGVERAKAVACTVGPVLVDHEHS